MTLASPTFLAPRQRSGHGLTIIEMIVVMGLLTMLFGIGIGTYMLMSKSFKEEGAISQLDVLLRQTRNSAVTANAPAYVEIDVENKRIVPWATRVIALWHFEDEKSGESTGSR